VEAAISCNSTALSFVICDTTAVSSMQSGAFFQMHEVRIVFFCFFLNIFESKVANKFVEYGKVGIG